jgi:predicted enzyme related to lactoylglutathione lyase
VTGDTTLALHPASPKNPAGTIQLGFGVSDIRAFYVEVMAKGVKFTLPPTEEEGATLARFLDSEGVECSVSGK